LHWELLLYPSFHLFANLYYVNIHSAAYPDGEIRGQLIKQTTGGGGTVIPAGSTGTNNATGTGSTVSNTPVEEPSAGGGGGGGGGGTLDPTLTLGTITVATTSGSAFAVPIASFSTVSVSVTAANYSANTDVTISVAKSGGSTEFAKVNVTAATLNGTHTSIVSELDTMLGLMSVISGTGNVNYDNKLVDHAKFTVGKTF